MNEKQCSELFIEVFDSRCGGCVRTCECGITHFDSFNIYDWEDGELEDLQKKAKETPKKYFEHDCAIGTIGINGIEIVYGCTCDLAKKYETFLISHGALIAEYLNKRAKMLREHADKITVQGQKQGKENYEL